MYDFHTHTSLSDGALSPMELIRRAAAQGYTAIGLTDHLGPGSLERVLAEVITDCALARQHWGIMAIPGVELTHLPPGAIAEAARRAKEKGAGLVVVHGETITEPVEQGTNRAAVECPHVDILAHPGLITLEEARLAAANSIFVELSARKGHSLANGHIVRVSAAAGAKLLLSSDAHDESDLLTPLLARHILRGAGLAEDALDGVLLLNARALLAKLRPEVAT